MTNVNFKIDEKLKIKIKTKAASQGKTLTEIATELLIIWLKD